MNDTVYGVSPGLAVHEMNIVGCDKTGNEIFFAA